MLAWQIWLIIAGICLILEIITVGFLIFWFAVAAAIVCLLSFFIDNVVIQTSIFLVLSVIFVFLTRPLANRVNKNDHAITNANRIINKEGIVKKEISRTENGQVKVNGDLWTAVLEDSTSSPIPVGTIIKVLRIDGVKLVVKPINLNDQSKFVTK